MFDKDYSFHGRHAERVKSLCDKFDEEGNVLFKRNLDVYLLAPIVGFMYNKKADRDKSSTETRNILVSQLNTEMDNLQFQYRLIMLMDKKHEPEQNKRVDKAFRHFGTEESKEDEELYEKYVLGGVDKLYEELMIKDKGVQNYLSNLYEFMESFDIEV